MFNASNNHFDLISKIIRTKNPFSNYKDGYIGNIRIILALFLATKQNKQYMNMLSNTGMVIFCSINFINLKKL